MATQPFLMCWQTFYFSLTNRTNRFGPTEHAWATWPSHHLKLRDRKKLKPFMLLMLASQCLRSYSDFNAHPLLFTSPPNHPGISLWLSFLQLPKTLGGRRQWHPTPVLLPGKSHGWRSLEGCSPWGHWGLDRLSDFTFTFHFHALEKEIETHSSVLAWRIPGTGEPGGLPSMGSHRVGHDWSDLAAAAARP